MQDVFYSESNRFGLTNKEFGEAMTAFGKKSNYYCKRLKSVLSPYYKFIRPTEENSMYLQSGDGRFLWICKSGKMYLYMVKGVLTNIIFKDDEQRKYFESRLLTPDEFYDGWEKGWKVEY